MGLMDSVEVGRACGSDTAHLALFGYDPRLCYRGRGAFESLGAGCSMQAGDIAFKSNLATLDEASGLVVQRRVDRTFHVEGPLLCAALDGAPCRTLPLRTESFGDNACVDEVGWGVVGGLAGPRAAAAAPGPAGGGWSSGVQHLVYNIWFTTSPLCTLTRSATFVQGSRCQSIQRCRWR